jgi:hypothetical protein
MYLNKKSLAKNTMAFKKYYPYLTILPFSLTRITAFDPLAAVDTGIISQVKSISGIWNGECESLPQVKYESFPDLINSKHFLHKKIRSGDNLQPNHGTSKGSGLGLGLPQSFWSRQHYPVVVLNGKSKICDR